MLFPLQCACSPTAVSQRLAQQETNDGQDGAAMFMWTWRIVAHVITQAEIGREKSGQRQKERVRRDCHAYWNEGQSGLHISWYHAHGRHHTSSGEMRCLKTANLSSCTPQLVLAAVMVATRKCRPENRLFFLPSSFKFFFYLIFPYYCGWVILASGIIEIP